VEEVTVHPITRHRHNRFVRRRHRRRLYPPAVEASAVDVDRPSEGMAGTIGSMLQHVTSRIPRLSSQPSGFRRLFLSRIFKNTQLTQIPLDPRAFLRRSGFACSSFQKIVSLMSIYIYYIYTNGDGCTSGIAANTIV